MDTNEPAPFLPSRRIIVVTDLANCAKAFQSRGDETMVALLNDYYTLCEQILPRKGGTIIKFLGDACLATFPPEEAAPAVGAVLELQAAVRALIERYQAPVELGANLHLTSAIESEFGAGGSRRRDILGRGVNQTFLLGRGAGVRLSEPMYRALPSNARSGWNKHRPPAVYHRGDADGILRGLGKDPVTNTQRW